MDLKRAYQRITAAVEGFANSSAEVRMPVVREIPKTKKQSTIPYLYGDAGYFKTILENPVTQQCMRMYIDSHVKESISRLIAKASEMTPETYPQTFATFTRCCKSLSYFTPPYAYISSEIRGVNAISIEVDRKQYIFISRSAVIFLSQEELSFILGHELGHHQQGNLVSHTMNGLYETYAHSSDIFGPILSEAVEVPLKRWCRDSEYTADRAGLICCKNIDVAIRVLSSLETVGISSSGFSKYRELSDSYPTIENRIKQIRNFYDSQQKNIKRT